MFPWLKGKAQHVVGYPVDVIKSKDSPPSSSSPWALDNWQLRDGEGKCQTLCHGLHFLPWPSAFSCCWTLAAGLDRSLVWPSPHFLLFSDKGWMLWKSLTATICLANTLVPFWEVGKVDVSQNWADVGRRLGNRVYNKFNKCIYLSLMNRNLFSFGFGRHVLCTHMYERIRYRWKEIYSNSLTLASITIFYHNIFTFYIDSPLMLLLPIPLLLRDVLFSTRLWQSQRSICNGKSFASCYL